MDSKLMYPLSIDFFYFFSAMKKAEKINNIQLKLDYI